MISQTQRVSVRQRSASVPMGPYLRSQPRYPCCSVSYVQHHSAQTYSYLEILLGEC
ncbi:MAG: hypothetical protein F6K04_08725 [Leptolyngbya sp. SIO4C5]|uniref:hypothetical protein n=1 Tax=Sphaerothrix gracilis TaxID=3151835 RepID=UPI0013BFB3E3|nr:hypothetical protein [Leptolyngbya sp. SIO4C5]